MFAAMSTIMTNEFATRKVNYAFAKIRALYLLRVQSKLLLETLKSLLVALVFFC